MKFNQHFRNVAGRIIFNFLISVCVLNAVLLYASHAQVTLDGSMGTSGALPGPDYDIIHDLGQVRGSNLFHSFGEFNVQTGESATFTGPSSIANILSRVTGGNQSFIDGVLASTIAGVNLYLLNPAGVLFGSNASLNVQGSFHVSTADYLRFSDGVEFHADLSRGSTLTVAPIAAFGFLKGNPAEISFDQSSIQVPVDETLSVIGGDINVEGGSLTASSGLINIVSVASQGEVIPNTTGESPELHVDSFEQLDEVSLARNTLINTSSSEGGGTVLIRGGRLIMKNESSIISNTFGDVDGNTVGIDVKVSEDFIIDNSVLQAATVGGGRSGDIKIESDSFKVKNRSEILAFTSGQGDSGDISISTKYLEVIDNSELQAATIGEGHSGDIKIESDSFEVKNHSIISAFTWGQRDSGDISINTKNLEVMDDSTLRVFTAGSGNSGNVNVEAESVIISDMDSDDGHTVISSESHSVGRGGNIDVNVTGDVFISAAEDATTTFTGIVTLAFETGNAGNLNLDARNISSRGNADVASRSTGPSDSGSVMVNTKWSLELSYGSRIGSFSVGTGASGNLSITAKNVVITGVSTSLDPNSSIDFTGFTTLTRDKNGGDMYVKADSIHVTDKGSLSAGTLGSGNSGDIVLDLDAGSLLVADGGLIISSAFSFGNGGNIEITAGDVTVSGAGHFVNLNNNGFTAIGSQTSGMSVGNAGDIQITAGSFKVLDGAGIRTNTFGRGRGGNIDVKADSVLVSGVNLELQENLINFKGDPVNARSSIDARTDRFSNNILNGDAGDVKIEADSSLEIRDHGLITSGTDTTGAGGNISLIGSNVTLESSAQVTAASTGINNSGGITINARSNFESDNSTVLTSAKLAGGGNISIAAGQDILLNNGTLISAKSSGSGNAGNITLNAGNTYLSENSSVATEAKQADGGSVNLTAGRLAYLVNSEITSSVGGGADTVGGNIIMNYPSVVIENSKIIARANEGSGGNIQITADVFMADHNSVVSASSAKGVDGEVDIRATVRNISGSIGPLREDYSSAQSLLLESCVVRMSDGKKSSLIAAGRDGLPVRPGDLMPSLVYDSDMARADAAVAGIWADESLAYGDNYFEKKGLLPLDMLKADTGCASCP